MVNDNAEGAIEMMLLLLMLLLLLSLCYCLFGSLLLLPLFQLFLFVRSFSTLAFAFCFSPKTLMTMVLCFEIKIGGNFTSFTPITSPASQPEVAASSSQRCSATKSQIQICDVIFCLFLSQRAHHSTTHKPLPPNWIELSFIVSIWIFRHIQQFPYTTIHIIHRIRLKSIHTAYKIRLGQNITYILSHTLTTTRFMWFYT